MYNTSFDSYRDEDADLIIQSIPGKQSPIFNGNGRSVKENRAILRYLFSRKPKKLPPSLKNRVIGLYDPLADRQHRFVDGLRWCCNVYVGCEHNCGYCYVNGYSQDRVGANAHAKVNYEKNLTNDLREIAELGVPSAPVHLSNSTDPLQAGLESQFGHTLLTLREIQRCRELVSHITILTKNPEQLCKPEYIEIVSAADFQPFTVQVTCTYWRDEPRAFYEPKAPNVQNRLDSISKLAKAGLDVELRIDPLFPSSRLTPPIVKHRDLSTYGLVEAQTREDMESLVDFVSSVGVKAIVAKPLRIPISKKAETAKNWFKDLYLDATGTGKRYTKGRSWRLPEEYQKELMHSLGHVCSQHGMHLKHCMHDVLTRK